MQRGNVIFTLNEVDLIFHCNENEVMKDICQKYANKIKRNINSLVFLYRENQLNLNLKFKDVIRDNKSKEMKVLVYSQVTDDCICPRCGNNINLNAEKIEDIILSINNIKETIDNAKLILENVIKISIVKDVSIQLKRIKIIFNSLSENIKKTKEKVKNLSNEKKIIENNYK